MLLLHPHDGGLGRRQAWNLLCGDPHQVRDFGQGRRHRSDPPDRQALKLIELSFHLV
jgi:hypothetical protein